MHKFFACIAIALSLLFVSASPSCEAREALTQKIEGVVYYKGDTNLPTYSHGSGGFSVMELDSAVLVNESKKTAVVDFYGFAILFNRGWNDPVDPPEEYGFNTHRLIYHKDTGKSEVVLDGRYTYKMIEGETKAGKLLYEHAAAAKSQTADD